MEAENKVEETVVPVEETVDVAVPTQETAEELTALESAEVRTDLENTEEDIEA